MSTDGRVSYFACVLCSRRKVKCDRILPACTSCIRGRAACNYQTPLPPKRRKKQNRDEALHARLRKYEGMLKDLGVDVDDAKDGKNEENAYGINMNTDSRKPRSMSDDTSIDNVSHAISRAHDLNNGRLIVSQSKTRYVENNLWTSLDDGIHRTDDPISSSSEEETGFASHPETSSIHEQALSLPTASFLFGSASVARSLTGLHPCPGHARKLWYIYKENVDPLIKLFHCPRKEETILKVISLGGKELTMRREALLFAIYLFSTSTLTEKSCLELFGVDLSTLLDRYRTATEQALINLNILTSSDAVVLQTFVLYLLCMRPKLDPPSLWILSGVAVRLAQRNGLHRDGPKIGASPYITEMFRRTWWQIIILDGRVAEMSGFRTSLWSQSWDTEYPLNVNDNDFDQDSAVLPPERNEATEMIYCLITYEIGNCFRVLDRMTESCATTTTSMIHEKDAVIDALETHLEQRYLRYCDPLNPVQYLSQITSRAAIATLRLMSHHPRQYVDKGASLPENEKDMLFGLALKVIEYDNLAYSVPSMQRFIWQIRTHFPWRDLIYVFNDLSERAASHDAERAWVLLESFFSHHPEISAAASVRPRKTLHAALCMLAIKAWDQHTKQAGHPIMGSSTLPKPCFIAGLEKERAVSQRNRAKYSTLKPSRAVSCWPGDKLNIPSEALAGTTEDAVDISMFAVDELSIDQSSMSWSQWDAMILQDLGVPSGPADFADCLLQDSRYFE